MAKWIGFSEAREMYLDLQGRRGHGAHCLEDWKHFARVTVEALIDNRKPLGGSQPLVAKSGLADTFRLSFKSENEEKNFPLLEGDQIPGLFWMSWREAIEHSERTPILQQNIHHAPTCYGDTFKFVLTGMKDGGTIEGYAERVQLLRDAIPLLPRGRGRSTGNHYDDSEAVEFAVSGLEAGRSWNEVIPLAVAMMDGSTEEKSRRNRLVQTRLKPLGFLPPARKRTGSKLD